MASEQRKVTVTLPEGLLERLNKTVPNRQRSLFISAAVEEHLDLMEQEAALEEAAGAWSLENHPTMDGDEGIDEWLEESRQGWG